MIYIPTKIFPCDCMGEGITVTQLYDKEDISEGEVKVSEDKELRDCQEFPFIQLSFWEYTSKYSDHRLTRLDRIKYAWHILCGRSPWPDMVIFKAKTAKHFANHLLYIISKSEKKENKKLLLVKE